MRAAQADAPYCGVADRIHPWAWTQFEDEVTRRPLGKHAEY